ncbi:MAG: hypothetical protein QXS06_03450 [Desulfurococcaceae archaeon]
MKKARGLRRRVMNKLRLKLFTLSLAFALIAVGVIYAFNVNIPLGRYNALVNIVEEAFVKEIRVKVLNVTFAEHVPILKHGDVVELKLVIDGEEYVMASIQYRPGLVQIGLETTLEFSEPRTLGEVIAQRLSVNVTGGETVFPLLRAPLSELKWIYIYSFWLMSPAYIEVEVLKLIKVVESIHIENYGDRELTVNYRASLINGTLVEVNRLIKPYSNYSMPIGLKEVASGEVIVSTEVAGMNMRVVNGVLVLVPRNSPLLTVLLAVLSALTILYSFLTLKDLS